MYRPLMLDQEILSAPAEDGLGRFDLKPPLIVLNSPDADSVNYTLIQTAWEKVKDNE